MPLTPPNDLSARDDRKSAALAASSMMAESGSRVIGRYSAAREILRSPKVRQAGAAADQQDLSKPDEISFFFLDGDKHRKRRAAVSGLFSPKAIATRHHLVMAHTMENIVTKLQRNGSAPLDELSWQMAVEVAADIIGLTNSDTNENLARRVKAVLESSMDRKKGLLGRLGYHVRLLLHVGGFWKEDLAPAIKARRAVPQDDVISYMVQEKMHDNGGA